MRRSQIVTAYSFLIEAKLSVDVVVVHWHEGELAEIITRLKSPDLNFRGHWNQGEKSDLNNPWPDALIISLDRLPSHGWAIAEWLWSAKKRQHIPIYFVGGELEKVAATKAKFPDGKHCNWEELTQLLKN